MFQDEENILAHQALLVFYLLDLNYFNDALMTHDVPLNKYFISSSVAVLETPRTV